MENEKKTSCSDPSNACNFLLGMWKYCECSSLVQRFWSKPGSHQVTTRQTFNSTTGTVEYRDILYGSHVHGEYRRDNHPDNQAMSVLLQRTARDELELTVATSQTHRFGGPARITSGSMVLEGRAIPFFVAHYLREARVPLVPQADSIPITTDAVCNARVELHPLRPDLWLLVVYHVLNMSSNHPTLLKTEVWHFRHELQTSADDRDTVSERRPELQSTPSSASAFTDLETRLDEIEHELEQKRREYEEFKSEQNVKSDREDAVDEIVELDLASFGLADASACVDPCSVLSHFDGAKYQGLYRSMIDLMERVRDLECDLQDAEDQIDDLEHEADDIEAALVQGYAEWEAREYGKAEAIIEQAPTRPDLADRPLLGHAAVGVLSGDARTILETYLQLDGLYTDRPDLQNLDCGPLVSSMSKLCERILADFLGPRCPAIYADPQVYSLLNDPKRMVTIPADDQAFKIDKGSLRKVLGLIEKPGPVNWSGTRNGAIALLLFGRTYKIGDGTDEEIANPLNVHGTEEECQELRLDLYRFQQLRNCFIHHDLAGWTEALKVKRCFEGCVKGLIRVLYDLSPT